MDLTALVYKLAVWSLPAFGVTLFALEIVSKEIGIWIAARYTRKATSSPEGVGVVVASMMGLLAFVLALTLSFASTRFNERLDGAIQEANAIGTSWLRAKAIGDPSGDDIARKLEDYTRLRADFIHAPAAVSDLDIISRRTADLQSGIWSDITAIVRRRPDPIAQSLMSSINQTFDATSTMRFAFEKRLPGGLFWLLIGMTCLSMGALGFQLGQRGRPLRLLGALLAAMWATVIVDIIDLAASRLGLFRTSTAPYEWTLESFQSGAPPAR